MGKEVVGPAAEEKDPRYQWMWSKIMLSFGYTSKQKDKWFVPPGIAKCHRSPPEPVLLRASRPAPRAARHRRLEGSSCISSPALTFHCYLPPRRPLAGPIS